ncbi:hypothetical protein ABIB49_003614 [Arthrobacter sp. UYCu512]
MRLSPNELWVTDITEHPTREGKVYCCAVMDTNSCRIVGWSIDSNQDSALVVNALDMAMRNRRPVPGGIVHADHGVQFTSWAFTNKIRSAGLMPSFGTIGDGYDNAMMESFWSSMQIELLNRKRWKTRTDLANAIFALLSRFSTTASAAIPDWTIGLRSSTSYTASTHPKQPETHSSRGNQSLRQVKLSTKPSAVPIFWCHAPINCHRSCCTEAGGAIFSRRVRTGGFALCLWPDPH